MSGKKTKTNNQKPLTLLITGASGYIGSLIVDAWLEDKRVGKVIAIDEKEPRFLFESKHPKIHFIKGSLSKLDLKENIKNLGPIDAAVHAAYVIRTPYFKNARRRQEEANFKGADNIFRFAIEEKIPSLVHFSTVASYGASKENTLEDVFKEERDLKEETITYGSDKRILENKLVSLVEKTLGAPQVVILRLGSVSGPFLHNFVKKTGLLSFLRGISPFIPVTSGRSARQYIHEDDVVSAVNFCLFNSFKSNPEIFNLAAPNRLTFPEIAKLLGKKTIRVPHSLAELAFKTLWHVSLGKIPTPPGVINSYSFPILVDTSKIVKAGFRYNYTQEEALLGSSGKFSDFVKES